MDNWFLNSIYDYWDMRTYWETGAHMPIYEYSRIIKKYNPKDREHALKLIQQAIEKHVAHLDDDKLTLAAFIIADDLYKAANEIRIYDPYISNYLEASAGTFFKLLKKRGYFIHYIVNNSFSDLQRPLHLFDLWYLSAGMKYVCPHKLALSLMETDGLDEKDFSVNLLDYIVEAEYVTEKIIDLCHSNNDNYILLHIDMPQVEAHFSFGGTKPGVITVHRCEAAIKGSRCRVYPPKEPYFPDDATYTNAQSHIQNLYEDM
jgi:hypothetical protein